MTKRSINNDTVSFISDWQKRTSKQQKKYIILIITALFVAFVLCTCFFFWFQNENYNRIVDQNMKYICDNALQETNQIENKLEDTVKVINNFSNQYSTLLQKDDNVSVTDKLKDIADKNLFDRIGFVLPDGTDITLEGQSNISDRGYFLEGLSGKTGYEFIELSRITNRPCMVFYAPVCVKTEIVGVMIGFYEMERLDNMFAYQLFNYTPRTYLIDETGRVIANSKKENISENMLDKLSTKKFTGNVDFDSIQKSIEDKNQTAVSFSFIDNKKTSVGVISQFINHDWMVLSILPDDVTESMTGKANSAGSTLLTLVITTLLLLICLLILILRNHNKRLKNEMTIAVDNLKTAVAHDQKQSLIIESLSNSYSSVYYIDIETQTYERFAEEDSNVSNIPPTGNWIDGFNIYISAFVDEGSREQLKNYTDFEYIKKHIDESNILINEYQRKDKLWRRAVMLPAEYGKNNNIKSVIFAVQIIELEKKKELETKLALQDAYKAAQLASNAKTTFLSNMSHDIRTPMNAIIGMTAIAAANLENSSKVSDCLKKITSSSKHLLGLINEVLDMSKIESGKVDLNEEQFSLSKLIDDLITINQPLINEKKHTLIVKANKLVHENVIGDSTRLQQVFTNLLTNAIKYTPDGGLIEFHITEKETNKTNVGWYEVIVKDNGIGMSEEFQKNMFEPFSRAKDKRISAIQGTGLGMPIARNIIRMMNGDITVSSKVDKGSTFTISFALKLQKENKEHYENFIDLPVLVVDDDPVACESTCLILDSLSMKSEWVTSGREAIKLAVEHHNNKDDYYALIIDWKMPDMNGIETTREIRKQIGNDISIIVISAYDLSDIEQEAREAGVDAFISKPLFKSKLINLFNELGQNESNNNTAVQHYDDKKLNLKGKRILLAEDNELNKEIAIELLSMLELKIEHAENGKVCLDKFIDSTSGYFDLILMDIQMPEMNGYETAMAIRASAHPDADKIPIIAMTANAFSTDVRAAYDSGMNGHLSKPIDIDVVVKTLEKHLSK